MKNLGWVLIVILLITTSAFADESVEILRDRLQSIQRQVLLDRQSNQLSKEQLNRWQEQSQRDAQYYKTHDISKAILNHADLELASAQARLQGIEIVTTSAQLQFADTHERIVELVKYQQQQALLVGQRADGKRKLAEIQVRLDLLKQLQTTEQERLDVLKTGKEIALQRLNLVQQAASNQNRIYQRQEQHRVLESSSKQMASLQSRLQGWLVSLANLQSQLSSVHQRELQVQILTAEEYVALLRTQITVLRTQYQIEELRVPVRKIHSVGQLNGLERNAKKILAQLEEIKQFTVTKNQYLDSKKSEIEQDLSKEDFAKLLTLVNALQADYYAINFKIDQLQAQTKLFAKDIRSSLKQELAVRQTLPPFEISAWANLGAKVFASLSMTLISMRAILVQCGEYLSNQSISLLMVFVSLFFLTWFWLRRGLLHLTANLWDYRQRFSDKLLYAACEISSRTLFSMMLFLVLAAFSLVSGIHLSLFLYLLFVYIAFKWAINIVRIALVESDVQLYQRLKWTVIFGALLTSFVVITHLLPVDFEVRALSNRVFMVFVLILGLFLFKGRKILPNLLKVMMPATRDYMHLVVGLLAFLLPLAFISNAVIGLCGYVELAFAISKYQAIFLMVMTGYLIIRGMLIDLLDFTSEVLIRHTKSGWVLTEAIVKPIDKILRIALLLGAVFLLIHLYDLDKNIPFMTAMHAFFHFKLFELGGNAITVLLLIKLLLIGVIIFWLSRWSREFSFRRLYLNAKDLGVRNSLSIFTQYAVVIVSVLLGLKIIGLELSGFAVVAAAFAAGIGFGLRDLANNFFSGILLLVERPFRTGDIVTLGEYEGEVVHTGLRSMMIRTWDRMEVIVPNADMFTKPFTNWTHQDSIVRTVIKIKIHREDDPHRVKQVILEVLAKIKPVVDNPGVEVFMQEIDDALIEMDVRYYVIVSPNQTRAKVRSDVLFALWDAFKANNIRPPYQHYDLSVVMSPSEQ